MAIRQLLSAHWKFPISYRRQQTI